MIDFIKKLPKVELHVHLEGSVNPETLLKLAEKNRIRLPASSLEEIKEWYIFKNFDQFIDVYLKISECIQTADDIELIAKEFLKNQKRQNIIYTEFTFTPYTHFLQKKIPFKAQLEALENARTWALEETGVDCRFIMDINRMVEPEEGVITAKWLLENQKSHIAALGLGGPEVGFPPERHKPAFDKISNSFYCSVPHAGETEGPSSVWGALKALNAKRIGHGVRSLEDPELIKYLQKKQICLEVCPTSNICLNVFESMKNHPLPKLVDAGLNITINSDDPPMFNTDLNNEYMVIAQTFGFTIDQFREFNFNAIESCFLKSHEKVLLKEKYLSAWRKISK